MFFPSDVVEYLCEIKIGNETYSGPSFGEFNKIYQRNYSADYIRLVIQASALPEGSRANSLITLILSRDGESSFQCIGSNSTWVSGVVKRFGEVIDAIPARNVLVHSVIFEMLVQLTAVILITVFSVFSANRLMHLMSIQFSEVYIFIVVFLFLSNVWTYGGKALIAIRNKYYPVVDILRRPRKQILLTVLMFVMSATAAWAIKSILDLIFLK